MHKNLRLVTFKLGFVLALVTSFGIAQTAGAHPVLAASQQGDHVKLLARVVYDSRGIVHTYTGNKEVIPLTVSSDGYFETDIFGETTPHGVIYEVWGQCISYSTGGSTHYQLNCRLRENGTVKYQNGNNLSYAHNISTDKYSAGGSGTTWILDNIHKEGRR